MKAVVEVADLRRLLDGDQTQLTIQADDALKEKILIVLALAVAVAASGQALAAPLRKLKQGIRFGPLISEIANQHGVDPCLVAAVIQTESSFDPEAIREEPQLGKIDGQNEASIGLMQVLVSTARDFQPGITRSELFDPRTNITIGVRLIEWLIRQGLKMPGDIDAYNVGIGNFKRGNRNRAYRERVLRHLQEVC